MKFHLAQVNVAYAKGLPDDPRMQSYLQRLDEINQLADHSPGFVWRYLTDSRDPLDRVMADPLVLFNLSVWESIEALHHYTYKTVHAEVYAGRKEWFVDWKAMAGEVEYKSNLAMWWIEAGQLPTAEEGKEKLRLISEQGPSPLAFHLKTRFSPEESVAYERCARGANAHNPVPGPRAGR